MVWTTKPPAGTQLDFTNPINNGLVGCWIFNEGSGTVVNDLSGNNNIGTLTNMASPSTPTSGWNSGRNGSTSIKFDGIDDFISVGNPTSVNISGEITVSTWVYPVDTSIKTYYIVSKRSYNVLINAANYAGFSGINADNTGWDTDAYGTYYQQLPINQWSHITIIYRISTQQKLVYTNGVAGTPTPKIDGAIGDATSHPLEIGRYTGGSSEFNGLIDEVRIWNRALSDSEILSLYNSPYSMFQQSTCPPIICSLNVTYNTKRLILW